VVPIENSTDGVVNSTLDMLIDSDELTITAEIAMQVSQCLLTRTGTLAGIQKVYSHPQALGQCRQWLSANLPNVAQIEVASTALAARLTKDDPVAAAVASELAGQLYDLKIAKRKIEDEVRNVTRFLVIGREPAPPTGRDKTSVLFSLKDQAGVLYRVLQPLADAGLNLSRIESRPSRKKLWDYVFFIDVDGHASEAGVKSAIAALGEKCEFVKVLGSYPRAVAQEEP
jgi:chorismate mutase/prephenate dehydratase